MFLRWSFWEVWLDCRDWIELGMKRCVGELEKKGSLRVEQIREYWDGVGMWNERMIAVWPEGCWWPKSVEDWYEGDRGRLDGWCEGGLRQQRNDCEGCMKMREWLKRVESLGTYVIEWVSHCHFCLALCFFGPPSHALVVIAWRGEGCRYMMLLG